MFFACILLTIAIAGGTLLTFLYQRHASFTLRLCMGACTGLALMATFGFFLSAALGLTLRSVALPTSLLILPALLLLRREVRTQMRNEITAGFAQWKALNAGGAILFYVALAVVLALAFGENIVQRPDGIYTGVANNLGDLPFHLNVISSLVDGHNIPVEDPSYAGAKFTYPILADFLTAMLLRAGAPMAGAMWLQNMVLALAFMGLLHHWARALTHDRLAAVFTPLLVIFSGGLGWWLLMQDLRTSDGSMIALLGHLPRDYTIVNNTIFRWGNSLTALLLPERSFLFGLSLTVFVFYLWWQAIESSAPLEAGPAIEPSPSRQMLAAGICAGLMPMIHTHGFVVLFGTGACLALLFRSLWRGWAIFLLAAVVIALPEVFWLFHGSAMDTRKFIGWQIGWDRAGHNPVWFWFVNTGLFIPLLLAAIFWRRSGYTVPQRLAVFYAPFALWFVVPNLLKLSPWIWDNIKFLFYWYVASTPLVAVVLARMWREGQRRRWIAAGLMATLTMSGALDILRVVTHASELQEFTRAGMEMADFIKLRLPPSVVVLHAPTWNSPVYLTGRRSLLGFSGWTWSRGLDSASREADIAVMYSDGPAGKRLIERYRLDYVLIGPLERTDERANLAFWDSCTRLAQIGEYQLYKTDCGK